MSDEPLHLSSLDLNSEPSPPTCYFDLLPPELAIDIVELAANSQNRRKTLRALCLTSRHLRSISQPLLLSHVDLKSDKRIACLVENNPLEALAMIRTITLHWHKRMKPPVALAQAVTSLEALVCTYQIVCLEPFLGSNIKFLALHGFNLHSQYVPRFRFHHLQFMELSKCKFFGRQIRFDLPSLQHLVYTPGELTPGVLDPQYFFDQISPSLVSISVQLSTSLPESIVRSPFISLYRRGDISQTPDPHSHLEDTQVFHLDTAILTNTADHANTLAGLESWTNLLKDRLKPEVLLFTRVQVSDVYLESVKKLEGVCRHRGIEVVWEKSRSIHPTFTFGSRWFIEWSEKRHKE